MSVIDSVVWITVAALLLLMFGPRVWHRERPPQKSGGDITWSDVKGIAGENGMTARHVLALMNDAIRERGAAWSWAGIREHAEKNQISAEDVLRLLNSEIRLRVTTRTTPRAFVRLKLDRKLEESDREGEEAAQSAREGR